MVTLGYSLGVARLSVKMRVWGHRHTSAVTMNMIKAVSGQGSLPTLLAARGRAQLSHSDWRCVQVVERRIGGPSRRQQQQLK